MTYQWQNREFEPAEVKVSRLPASARDLMWLDLRLARYVPEDRRAENLAEAQRAYDRYPGDPLAARVLAQAHMDMQQDKDAVRVLDSHLAQNPEDALALRLKAVALMNVGDEEADQRSSLYQQAQAALAAAYRLDATDYRTYMAMARNRRGQPDYPTENDLQVLLLGSELAPQIQQLRFEAGAALMAHARYVEAISYLAPLANDPHGGKELDEVRRILNEARAKAGLASAGDEAPSADEGSDEATPTAS